MFGVPLARKCGILYLRNDTRLPCRRLVNKYTPLTSTQAIGRQGELLAKNYLKDKGYQILEQNWRRGRAEIDLIARDGEALVFIEVKTRSTDFFGRPDSFFSPRQAALISSAAAAYMEEIGHDWELRFDVISIILYPGGRYELEHIVDAFFPGLTDF